MLTMYRLFIKLSALFLMLVLLFSMACIAEDNSSSISLPEKKLLFRGKSFQLEPLFPDSVFSYFCQWESSDPTVATVNSKGVVNGIKAGKAKITATTFGDQQATCTVTVITRCGRPEQVPSLGNVPEYDLSNMLDISVRPDRGFQDIAFFNGSLFGFNSGRMYVDGEVFHIRNGHGNNCMFGNTLHYDYPYLYCGSWNMNNCKVYVNQFTGEGVKLVRTIKYPSLKGHLNCCVDEAKQLIYILLSKSEKTRLGDVDFIVSDFRGNIVSRQEFGYLPVIQGMTFHRGKIYVVSGFGHEPYPNCLSVLNTSGELIACTSKTNVDGEVEGVDFDGDSIVIASRIWLYRE